MKKLLITTFLATLVLFDTGAVFAQRGSRGPSADDPVIVQKMQVAGRSFRQLRRQFQDEAKKDENLELVAAIKNSLLAAKQEEPLKTPNLPAEEKDQFLSDYRGMLDTVVDLLGKLETSLKESNFDLAREQILKLNEFRTDGHDKFQQEE
jgi:soluble cytochrome b562